MPKPLAALAAALLSIPLAACGTAPPPGPAPVSRLAASQAPVPEYRIQIGDALGIKFFLNPELNEEIVVRPDGRISLQLIPEIVVAAYEPQLREPTGGYLVAATRRRASSGVLTMGMMMPCAPTSRNLPAVPKPSRGTRTTGVTLQIHPSAGSVEQIGRAPPLARALRVSSRVPT